MSGSKLNENAKTLCVIGAGPSGICALKHALSNGMLATAYEKAPNLGGTWRFDAKPSNKYEVHSSMYEKLRTNLPKEVMGFPDFEYEPSDASFIDSEDVLQFFVDYAKHFELLKHIQFEREVIRVRPVGNVWELLIRKEGENCLERVYYDYVIVCNGHYFDPMWPKIDDMQLFAGQQIHCHSYRKPEEFQNRRVLVIGGGPGGIDVVDHIRDLASHVYYSHHLPEQPDTQHMANVTQKPDVLRFTEMGAVFKDDSTAEFDAVIYCTGYNYKFPFLSVDCDVRATDNCIKPLFKHVININHPSMAFIGLTYKVCPTQTFDLQARFAVKFFSGQKQLPSYEEMYADYAMDIELRKERGMTKRRGHDMGGIQLDYYKSLADLAEIDNIKPVIHKIMTECGCKYIYELKTYRDGVFKVLDDENFEKTVKQSSN